MKDLSEILSSRGNKLFFLLEIETHLFILFFQLILNTLILISNTFLFVSFYMTCKEDDISKYLHKYPVLKQIIICLKIIVSSYNYVFIVPFMYSSFYVFRESGDLHISYSLVAAFNIISSILLGILYYLSFSFFDTF